MQKIIETVTEVILAVLPVTIIVIILQILLKMPPIVGGQFLIGVALVAVGLVLFLLGVHFGLLPLGETIGAHLPQLGKLWIVLLFGFLLGLVVTIAEPNIRVLATQVEAVSNGAISKNLLICTVAIGVGLFICLALLRIASGISIKFLLIIGYALVLILALFAPPEFVPVSLDAGGVTTGQMVIPFILALGVGIASVLQGKRASSDGFGLVALASIGPVLAVLLLGVLYG